MSDFDNGSAQIVEAVNENRVLKKRIEELEAEQCNEWHEKLSDEGLINYGDTPDQGIKSIKVLVDVDPKRYYALKAKLDAVRPYIRHKPDCILNTDYKKNKCTCGLQAALNGEDDE